MRGSRVTTKIPVATGDSSQDDRPACRLAANGKSRWCFWERSSSDSRPPPGLLRGEGIGKKKGVARVSTTRFGINKDIPGLYNSASQAHLLRVVTRTVFYLCSCWQQAPTLGQCLVMRIKSPGWSSELCFSGKDRKSEEEGHQYV